MRSVTDQLGYTVTLGDYPRRIVSLVPSQTELLFDLGLGGAVVGITRFCTRPPEGVRGKIRVGGTKDVKSDIIDALKPDLIIGNKEENNKEDIGRLKDRYPVWMSDVQTLGDARAMILSIGAVTGVEEPAKKIVDNIDAAFATLSRAKSASVLYLIWKKPWMAAGKNTFIDAMLETCGLTNCVRSPRYPELSMEDMQTLSPELIFLSSEPYPFRERHRLELAGLFPSAKVMCVDGEMFSWYGSRLVLAPAYFRNLLQH